MSPIPSKILIVEDSEIVAEDLCVKLSQEGYDVCGVVSRGDDAIDYARRLCPDLILMDINLEGEIDGIEAAQKIRRENETPLVYLTGLADKATLARAADTRPSAYLLKPLDLRQILTTITLLLERRVVDEIEVVEKSVVNDLEVEGQIVAAHASMERLLDAAIKVARTEVPVHIYGEHGTGKELIADLIHRYSFRSNESFIKLNCSTIPSNLLESALFGHAKGSFTGASRDHVGFIEAAKHGTLFLDEVADISTDIQVKLLRFLQTGQYYRVGETKCRTATPPVDNCN